MARTLVASCIAWLAFAAMAAATERSVRVGDNWFVAPTGTHTVSVQRGTSVSWRFVGQAPHNVSVTSGPVRFRSPTRVSGTYRRRMTRRGTYRIICDIHGDAQSMTLRVR